MYLYKFIEQFFEICFVKIWKWKTRSPEKLILWKRKQDLKIVNFDHDFALKIYKTNETSNIIT